MLRNAPPFTAKTVTRQVECGAPNWVSFDTPKEIWGVVRENPSKVPWGTEELIMTGSLEANIVNLTIWNGGEDTQHIDYFSAGWCT